jgi:hypothetical protein
MKPSTPETERDHQDIMTLLALAILTFTHGEV